MHAFHFFFVLHLSIILSSIASCLITFIHLYGFLVLIILNHIYVPRVKLYSFLYPLSIMTKRGRKCGFFLIFYMLGGVVFHLVRGSIYLLVVLGASFSFLYISFVTIFTYIVLIFDIYIYIYDVCFLHLPLHVLFIFSIYTHVSL